MIRVVRQLSERARSFLLIVARANSAASAVAKNFGIRILLLAVNLGTGVVVARSLAAEGRGEQAAIALWPVLIGALTTLGIPTALNYTARRSPRDSASLAFVAAVISIAIGLVVGVVGAVVVPSLLHGYRPAAVRTAQWLMVFVPIVLLLGVMRAHLESRGEYTRSMLGQLTPNVCTLVALIGLRACNELTPESAALSYLIPGGVLTAWLSIRLWPRVNTSFLHFRDNARALLSYGLRSYGTDVVTALASQLDMAVIVTFLTPVALGLYTVSLSLARILTLIPQSLVMVLFPHASGLEPSEALIVVARGARLSTAVSICFGFLLAIVGPILLPLVYGRSFGQAVEILPFLIAEQVFVGLATVLSQAFLATGRPTIVTLFQAVWLGSALICMFIFVPRLSIIGAALALLAASLIRLALVLVTHCFIFRAALPRLLPDLSDLAYVRSKLDRFRATQKAAFAE